MTAIQKTYFEDYFVRVVQPAVPLAQGAIEVMSKTTDDVSKYGAIFDVYQKYKHGMGAKGHSIIMQLDSDTCQIVPHFHRGVQSYIKQITVLWNLFAPTKLAWTSKMTDEETLTQVLSGLVPPSSGEESKTDPKCAFCNKKRIKAQEITENVQTRLMFNFKPITSNDLLIVSKEHIKELTKPLFIEMMTQAKKVTSDFARQGFKYSTVLFNDDRSAGRTMEHLHMHTTIAKDKIEKNLGYMNVFRKIVIDSWLPCLFRLSDNQLGDKIIKVKTVLGI